MTRRCSVPRLACSGPTLGLLLLLVLGLVLSGCTTLAAPEPQGVWDQDCYWMRAQEPPLPRLYSLYTSAHWAQRQATRQRLHVHVPTVDRYALVRDTHPTLDAIPDQLPDPLPTYRVGDQETFWLIDVAGHTSWEINARLVHKSDTSYAWVEVDADANEKYVSQLAATFDTQIYHPIRTYFGPEIPLGFDRDPRTHLLFARGLGAVRGYFAPTAGISRQVNPLSNEKDMLFLNLDFMGQRQEDLGVLAHEFEHLIHWYQAPGERSFLDEGFAELATIRWAPLKVNDNRLDSYDRYRSHPALQLNDWSIDDYGLVERYYGAGLGFAVYLTELFGSTFVRTAVAEPKRGISGLESLIQQQDCAFTFDDIFADFALANLVWDPLQVGSVGPLGLGTLAPWLEPVRSTRLVQTPLRDDEAIADTLPPYAIGYIRADPDVLDVDTTITFAGAPAVSIVPDDRTKGMVMWSNRHNEGRARLARTFDLTALEAGQPVVLETRMWWDIEEGWDFAYVMASRNGRDWTMLESEVTVPRDRHGRSLGPALTGRNEPTDQVWSHVQWDLTAYAGATVWLRFDYVTDGAITEMGWVIDTVAIDAIGYQENFDGVLADWELDGWIQTPNSVPVDWLVQAVALTQNSRELRMLERWLADMSGQATLRIPGLADDEQLYLLITPLAPLVTESAPYTLRMVDEPLGDSHGRDTT